MKRKSNNPRNMNPGANHTNMAVVMYMVDAMEYFDGQPQEFIKQAAFEIAMLGTRGIRPEQQDYKLTNIPEKTFSGYKLFAYYYVSFALAMPEMLRAIKVPYEDEYGLALKLRKK